MLKVNRHRLPTSWITLFFIATIVLFPRLAYSQGSEKYLYDDLGRLIRVIRADGMVMTYDYDRVGNLLGVMTGSTTDFGVPTIETVAPASVRAGGKRDIVISVARERFPRTSSMKAPSSS
ncbi:MAG: RHS repeat domain-containing protein [Nitrospirota bacterium]